MAVLKGDIIKVVDKTDGNSYRCRVEDVKGGKVRVHYVGWKKTYDEWIECSSSRILKMNEADVDAESEKCVRVKMQEASARTSASKETLSSSDLTICGSGEGQRGGVESDGSVERDCSFCSLNISGDRLLCYKCGSSFHAEKICVGVDDSVIKCILDDKKGAVAYLCCLCRNRRRDSDNAELSTKGDAFGQLFTMVGCLVGQMRELMTRVGKQGDGQSGVDVGSSVAAEMVSRGRLMEEVRELNEREKRKKSIIFRGFGCDNVESLQSKFASMCELLGLENINLESIVEIRSSGLFRARITDDNVRMNLLTEVKRLKNIDGYEHCYVQKDLTYRQRRELIDRRRGELGLQGVGSRAAGSSGVDSEIVGASGGGVRRGGAVAGLSAVVRGGGSAGANFRGNRAPLRGRR